jgi:molecular chaperone GrpE
MFRRRNPEVVPLEVARQLHADRERAVGELDRARHETAVLRKALEQREAERHRVAEHLRDAEAEACASLRSQLDAARARIGQLEAAHSAALAEIDTLHRSEPDAARVEELKVDLANLRRRQDKDVALQVRSEKLRLLGRLAEVGDSVHWALGANPDPSSPWYAGLIAIRDQVDQQLEAEGATRFGAAGEAFDPRVHDAVGTAPGAVAGRIARVESPGVRLADGTLVRPARVLVAA